MRSARFDLTTAKETTDHEVVSRTFKSLRFSPHPRRKILIIRGEIVITVTGSLYDQVIDEDIQEFRKLIKLESLSSDTNIRLVIEDILDQCPFIHDDVIPQLFDSLELLKNRKYDRHGLTAQSVDGEYHSTNCAFPEYLNDDEDGTVCSEIELKDVKMDSLDLYVELLYEDLQDKIKGAKSMWKLSTASENLVTIFSHDTALNAVFRTLREDYRKSIELTTNLLSLILAFAQFHDFHPLLISNKICTVTIDIIEFELSRYEKWVEELYRRKELTESADTVTVKQKADFDKMRAKFSELRRKQDQLLTAGFDVVKYLSEGPAFAKEVHHRGIIDLLMSTFERTNIRLFTVVVSFLVNLSSYREAVREMAKLKIVQQTLRFLDPSGSQDLIIEILKLYYNLSFNTQLRFKMIRLGVIAKLSQLFDDSEFEGFCIVLMYYASIDHRVRPKFITTDVIPKLVAKILGPTDSLNILETKALLLNLAASKRCTLTICGNNRLSALVKIGLQRQDYIILKIVRKISEHMGPTRILFRDLIANIVSAVKDKSNPEFVIECLGTLSNLALPDIDFCELLQAYQLLTYVRNVLTRPLPRLRVHGGDERGIPESLLLESIIFVGTCGSEPGCADFLIQEGFLEYLYQLGRAPALDTDVRLQLLYTIYRMSSHTKSRNYMIEKTKIPDLVNGFVCSECAELREVAQAVWSVFGEYNDEWKDKVRSELFLAHNESWLDVIGRSGQIKMDLGMLSQFQARLDASRSSSFGKYKPRRNTSSKISSESNEDESEEEDSEEESDGEDFDDDEEDFESSGGGDDERGHPYSARSDDLEGSESDQSRDRSIFDQFKHQFNQEMVNRIYGMDSDDEQDELMIRNERASGDSGDKFGTRNSRPPSSTSSRQLSMSRSRPQTSGTTPMKARPLTAHHCNRVIGGSASARGTSTIPYLQNLSTPGPPPSSLSSSSSSLESSQSLGPCPNEIHPSKGMKPPIIVNIKPKESW